MNRDRKKVELLLDQHWRVLIVWECVIKECDPDDSDQLALVVSQWIKSNVAYEELIPG